MLGLGRTVKENRTVSFELMQFQMRKVDCNSKDD